jgi:hypothetical protein
MTISQPSLDARTQQSIVLHAVDCIDHGNESVLQEAAMGITFFYAMVLHIMVDHSWAMRDPATQPPFF